MRENTLFKLWNKVGVILLDLPFLPMLSQEVCFILCPTVQICNFNLKIPFH